MGEGGLQVVFAISCKNNLSDLSVPPFNVTDCSSSGGGTLPLCFNSPYSHFRATDTPRILAVEEADEKVTSGFMQINN